MALTAEEQKIFDFAKESLPKWFFAESRPEEVLAAFAKMFGRIEEYANDTFRQTYILEATNLPPDYLNQHAIDRGTARQSGETNAALRKRIRSMSSALILSAIEETVQTVLDGFGFAGLPSVAEIRPCRACFGDFTSQTGIGGTFVDEGGGTFSFTPTAAFQNPILKNPTIVLSGASSGVNNGTFVITGFSGNGVTYANGSGVAETDATVSWTIAKRSFYDENIDGFNKSFMSRGFRFEAQRPTILIILPFGCTTEMVNAIREALRQRKGAGAVVIIECRQNP